LHHPYHCGFPRLTRPEPRTEHAFGSLIDAERHGRAGLPRG
jgi:hypothetical protein